MPRIDNGIFLAAVGHRIKRIRENRGLSQQQLGDLIGLPKQTIHYAETMKRQPKLSTIYRIAGGLECSMKELMPNEYVGRS